ncbi:MAG TPA: hypothetical protein VHP34_10405 [Alphaproteobacteria bacterium]|nr:hypothetical protein [Alphaproteobacteria bacterium]
MLKKMLAFVSLAALWAAMAAATFGTLLALKEPLGMLSSTFVSTFLAMVAYQAIAVFWGGFTWWRKMAGFCIAAVTFILVFAVTKYVLVEVYARSLTDVFMGVGIADELAFVVGAVVQIVLMYWMWRKAKTPQATSPLGGQSWSTLKPLLHHLRNSMKAASLFQIMVIGLLMANAFLSYQVWDTATDAVWQASEAREAAGDAVDAALLCQ